MIKDFELCSRGTRDSKLSRLKMRSKDSRPSYQTKTGRGDQIEFRNLTVTVDDVVPEEVLNVEAAETSGPRTPFTATMKAQVHCSLRGKRDTAPVLFVN